MWARGLRSAGRSGPGWGASITKALNGVQSAVWVQMVSLRRIKSGANTKIRTTHVLVLRERNQPGIVIRAGTATEEGNRVKQEVVARVRIL